LETKSRPIRKQQLQEITLHGHSIPIQKVNTYKNSHLVPSESQLLNISITLMLELSYISQLLSPRLGICVQMVLVILNCLKDHNGFMNTLLLRKETQLECFTIQEILMVLYQPMEL